MLSRHEKFRTAETSSFLCSTHQNKQKREMIKENANYKDILKESKILDEYVMRKMKELV